MKVKKAIIPAAGLGTRVLPASKAVPKEMLNIVDKPAIQYLVEEAVAAGIEDILIITNRGKGVIEDHFDHSFELEANLAGKKNKEKIYEEVKAVANLANIYFIRQKETKGLGHAILCGKSNELPQDHREAHSRAGHVELCYSRQSRSPARGVRYARKGTDYC